jgi:beta-phosphoglucomutase-like phosphatase (HAD superfamily)
MNKAFIFDFDGVLVNNEPIWDIEKEVVFSQMFGANMFKKLGPTVGLNIDAIHQKTRDLGSAVSMPELVHAFRERAPEVYRNAPLTPGLEELKIELTRLNFHLGIVSASPREWIDIVLDRLTWSASEFKIVLSLQDRVDLAHKPSPDGYIHAMQELGASPKTTLILEDSNTGIASAKASGATVIGFKANLVPGYMQKGADFYANTTEDVLRLARVFKG